MENSLRTPSFAYNHGGYYAPADPRECNTPGGPCPACRVRIDAMRPEFMEPCPQCNAVGCSVTHASVGLKPCNGCPEGTCSKCFHGTRYFCPLRTGGVELVRQETLGVRSPKMEEKKENK